MISIIYRLRGATYDVTAVEAVTTRATPDICRHVNEIYSLVYLTFFFIRTELIKNDGGTLWCSALRALPAVPFP